MTPEFQNLINQSQQNLAAAQFKMYLLVYSTYAAILICAIFSILIFWKLCQIHKHLTATDQPQNPFRPAGPIADLAAGSAANQAAHTEPPPDSEDKRYMPKT